MATGEDELVVLNAAAAAAIKAAAIAPMANMAPIGNAATPANSQKFRR
jgi:hypothetical protein